MFQEITKIYKWIVTEVSVHTFQASNFVDFIEFYTPHAYDIYAKNPYLKIDKCKSPHFLETRSNIQCLYLWKFNS